MSGHPETPEKPTYPNKQIQSKKYLPSNMKYFATKTNLAIACAGLLLPLAASAQTNIFTDNYNVANGNLDTASLAGRTNGLAGGVLPQSTTVEQGISGNALKLYPGGGDGTGKSGAMRFDTIGHTTNLWDWSSGAGGTAITNAGGMSISFNWTANNTTSSDWIFLAAGADPADIYGLNYALLAASSATSSGILIANNGTVQAYNQGVLSASGSFTPAGTNHVVKLDYQFKSWAAGSPVTVNVIVDGNYVINDSFTWKYGAGKQYLDLGTYQETNVVDNFKVSTFVGTIASGFSTNTFVNNGTLPWGAHADNGSEWYTPTNSSGLPCVTFSSNALTLTSYYIPQNGYNYQAGVVYATAEVPASGYTYATVDVDIYSPYAGTTGCWPAWWLDSAWNWPPEIDIAEFKGNVGGGNVWQNAVGSDGNWKVVISTINNTQWHHYGLALGPIAAGARTYELFLDGTLKNQGSIPDAQGGVPFWIIANYAMEGASLTPGPTTTTTIQMKNYVLATH